MSESRHGTPHIVSKTELSPSEAKWVTLKKVHWKDQTGQDRTWEYAERMTRGSSGVDAVTIFALIRSKTAAFPPSTIVVEQFRPPIDEFAVEFPAGLIDTSETAEQAAVRELREETGYIADDIQHTSAILVGSPGLTSSNSKFVSLRVTLPDQLETPRQRLDDDEDITVRVIEVNRLLEELKAYETKGYQVGAGLYHFAWGFSFAEKMHV